MVNETMRRRCIITLSGIVPAASRKAIVVDSERQNARAHAYRRFHLDRLDKTKVLSPRPLIRAEMDKMAAEMERATRQRKDDEHMLLKRAVELILGCSGSCNADELERIDKAIEIVVGERRYPIVILAKLYWELEGSSVPREAKIRIIATAIERVVEHNQLDNRSIQRMLFEYGERYGEDADYQKLMDRHIAKKRSITYAKIIVDTCRLMVDLAKDFSIEPPEYEDIMALPKSADRKKVDALLKENVELRARYKERIRRELLDGAATIFPGFVETYSIRSDATVYDLIIGVTKAVIREAPDPDMAMYAVGMISTALREANANRFYRGMVLFTAVEYLASGGEGIRIGLVGLLRQYGKEIMPTEDVIDVSRLIEELEGWSTERFFVLVCL